ncbi:enoyl-CoA hydratase/isomerase family protein [Bordetella petrii]|nr:enoyl-CoA hydratase/isomerase family protein [Bordetella petrii]
MNDSGVSIEIKDYVATVTLNHPPVNAVGPIQMEAITAAFDAFSYRKDVRVAILTGAGKVFCAGADLKLRLNRLQNDDFQQPGAKQHHSRAARECFNAIMECTVPVIGAINGPALGAGLVLAGCCDFLIASETAYFALPEINVGLMGGGRMAQRMFGLYQARYMMCTGEKITAQEALGLRVVTKVVPAEQIQEAAQALAASIAEKSPTASRFAKRAMSTIEYMTLRDGYRCEQEFTHELTDTPDAKEAALAFREKRKAIYE